MTVTHRKRQHQPEEIQTVNEPGLQIQCDGCDCDLTHSIRIKCADPVCETGDGVDICPSCFCAGKEFHRHKRNHAYRIVELHSYPIFEEDWGADEELLLLEGIASQGLGNWGAIAEHVGTRTKEEVEKHYNDVYINSPNWPLPIMDREFDIDPSEFQERKRRRIGKMNSAVPPPPKVAPTSAPGVHEVGGFLPGRLEFEHEIDNDAEDLVKDLEFGVVLKWGGDSIPEDENDLEVKARKKWEEEMKALREQPPTGGKRYPNGFGNGFAPNGMFHFGGSVNGGESQSQTPKPKGDSENADGEGEEGSEEPVLPPPIETDDSLEFKLALLEMYAQKVEKRHEAKALIFDRNLTNYKQMQAVEKKRSKEDREFLTRMRPFAKMQTADDFETFVADLLYESILRKRIAELQHYRRMGLTTPTDIDKYEVDLAKRTAAKANANEKYYPPTQLRPGSARQSLGPDSRRESERRSHERELTPKVSVTGMGPPGRKMPAPLNLANSPSLHLLTPEEQTLCSTLRLLPKPYLVVKETLIREYARRGGKLRRREARDLVKIDVNKTSRVWDFLVQAGLMRVGGPTDLSAVGGAAGSTTTSQDHSNRASAAPTLSASPSKDSQMRVSPKPPFTNNPLPTHVSALSSSSLPIAPNSSWPTG